MTEGTLQPPSSTPPRAAPDRRLSVAPMMDCTDRFDRFFLRQISAQTLLYTEMVTTGAILKGDRERYLRFDSAEHPVALQLGGADPADLAACARVGEDFGYDEINLNVGCPSDRVQSGRFGACLMAEPQLVAEGVGAMQDAVSVPVTAKCRIGIDDREDYAFLQEFVGAVRNAGCQTVIIHARMAILSGLTPKQNREIPPLRYDVAARIKADFPDLEVILNGGVADLDEAADHLDTFDGVMIGRAAYHTPWILAEADARVFGTSPAARARDEVVHAMLPYVEKQVSTGVPLQRITRHMLGLFHGQPGGRAWRRYLSENAHRPGAGPEVLEKALAFTASDRRAAA